MLHCVFFYSILSFQLRTAYFFTVFLYSFLSQLYFFKCVIKLTNYSLLSVKPVALFIYSTLLYFTILCLLVLVLCVCVAILIHTPETVCSIQRIKDPRLSQTLLFLTLLYFILLYFTLLDLTLFCFTLHYSTLLYTLQYLRDHSLHIISYIIYSIFPTFQASEVAKKLSVPTVVMPCASESDFLAACIKVQKTTRCFVLHCIDMICVVQHGRCHSDCKLCNVLHLN